jgi:serine/threonine protein kinase
MPFLTPKERVGQYLGGRYLIESILAQGGMGTLFAAHDNATGNRVAIKVLKEQSAHDQRSISRFQKEAETMRRLGHPYIVRIFDIGQTDDGVHFVVMELLQGRSLAQELETRCQLGAEETLSLLLPLMGALAVAHDNGIIHRDIKPSNIFLCRDEAGKASPKLLDFGIAKVMGDIQGTHDTKTGTVIGTPEYMSPEQAEGDDASPAVDVWAMGVVLFRCLTGTLPFSAPTQVGVLLKVVNETAPSLVEVAQDVGKKFCAAVDRALNHDLQSRYPNMRTFASALLATAKADAIALPSNPDPIGLPEWGKWLSGELSEQHTTSEIVPCDSLKKTRGKPRRSNEDLGPRAFYAPSTPSAVSWTNPKPNNATSRNGTRILTAVIGLSVLVALVAGILSTRSRRDVTVTPFNSDSTIQTRIDGVSTTHFETPTPSRLPQSPKAKELNEQPIPTSQQAVAEERPASGPLIKRRNKPSRVDKKISDRASPIADIPDDVRGKGLPSQANIPNTNAGTNSSETTAKGRGNTEIFINYDE